jgi:hypothetical protein
VIEVLFVKDLFTLFDFWDRTLLTISSISSCGFGFSLMGIGAGFEDAISIDLVYVPSC